MHRAPLLALLALLVGCGGDGVTGERTPNDPPDTDITGRPPSLESTETTVEFRWSGSDSDGFVGEYEWALLNNGTDGCVDPDEIVGLQWNRTEDTQITLRVTVSQEVEEGLFAESYSFWVRAVDNDGDVDPSPSCLAFTARTLSPTVRIVEPAPGGLSSCRDAPRTVRFYWTTEDLDIQEDDVLQTRWVLLPWSDTGGACFDETDFENQNPITDLAPDDPRWSAWADYDPAMPVTSTHTFNDLDPLQPALFAVQARDPDGAVSTFFRWDQEVYSIQPRAGVAPTLSVYSAQLGFVSIDLSDGAAVEAFEGEGISFQWDAEVADGQGIIDGYRYGWGVTNPLDENDPNWAIDWDPEVVASPAQILAAGVETYVVAARSADGEITSWSYDIDVVDVPAWADRSDLLLVDDTRSDPGSAAWEAERDAHWNDSLQDAGLANFDVIDAALNPELLTFETLAGYKAVIWASNADNNSFLSVDWVSDARARRGQTVLQRYQSFVGNLLLAGPGVAAKISAIPYTSGPDPLLFADRAPDASCWDDCATPVATAPSSSWMQSGMCVSMIEHVRPPLGFLYGETPPPFARSIGCDALLVAVVGDDFTGQFGDLQPRSFRTDLDPLLQLGSEEAYDNFAVWPDRPLLGTRVFDCHELMFVHSSRWANPGLVDVSACLEPTRPVDGAACGLRVTTYSQFKEIPTSADYLWGFEITGFEQADVADALAFVLEDWGLVAAP